MNNIIAGIIVMVIVFIVIAFIIFDMENKDK